MAEIDREYMEASMANLRQQQQEALELLERTRGALMFGEALLARLDQQPEPARKGDE